jgi:Cold shock proteins
LHASVLPADLPAPKAGQKLEYGVAEGRRGPQAISVTVPVDAPSMTKLHRRKPQELAPVVEDLIRVLDAASNSLQRGKYPDNAKQVAKVLHAVAEDFGA